MAKMTNTKNYKPMFDRIKAESEATNAETEDRALRTNAMGDTYKKGGKVSASSRADGCATKGKTKGRII